MCLRFLALVFHLEQYGAVGDDEFVVTEVLAKEFFEESISINSIFSQRKKLVAPMPPFHFPNRKKCNMQGRLNYLQLSTQQYYFKWSSQVGSRTSVFSFKLLHVGFQEVSLFL